MIFNKNMNPDHFLKNNSKNDMNSDHLPNSTNDLKIFYGTKKKETKNNKTKATFFPSNI